MISQKASKFFHEKNWNVFIEVLSPLQKTVLIAISRRKVTVKSLSSKLFYSPATIRTVLLDFLKLGVLEKTEDNLYKIAESELTKSCDSFRIKDSVDLKEEDITARIRSDVYRVCVELFEPLEHSGYLRGNAHHKAQKMAELAVDEFLVHKNKNRLK